MAVTLSDDEIYDHESKSDQKWNFMAFTATTIVSEIEIANENPSDGELSENVDLQEAYNKFCKIAAKCHNCWSKAEKDKHPWTREEKIVVKTVWCQWTLKSC